MSPELIERLARDCIAEDWDDHIPGRYREMDLAKFVALVAEECAQTCEEIEKRRKAGRADESEAMALWEAAEVIRSRFVY